MVGQRGAAPGRGGAAAPGGRGAAATAEAEGGAAFPRDACERRGSDARPPEVGRVAPWKIGG